MARKRFIAPEFFTHGELFDAERDSGLPLRIAYASLWCQADRRGLFVWKPRELKLQCVPYDPCDFAEVLAALERFGFIESYEVDGKRHGRIPSFEDHQTFHPNEKPNSAIPAPTSDVEEPSQNASESHEERPKPTIGRRETTNGRHSRAAVTAVTAVTTASTTTERQGASADAPAKPPSRSVGPSKSHYADTEQRLRDAALPHERLALDVLLQTHPYPDQLVLNLDAVASGMHLVRGNKTGNPADITHVMQAISEMAANGEKFSVSLFRGYVRRIADRPPEPASPEERAQSKLANEIAAAAEREKIALVESPRTESPEERARLDEQRAAAMAHFRQAFRGHNPNLQVSAA